MAHSPSPRAAARRLADARPRRAGATQPGVLLTGFEPFGGDAVNPSALVARALHGRRVAGHRIEALVLPTAFGQAAERLGERVRAQRPALVLCLGLAGGREALSLERVAINLDDARIADNAGARPVDRPVVPAAPAAYFARLPIKAMVVAMRRAGLAAEVSNTAGSFVCNHVFFALMHLLATGRGLRGTQGGFLHLPWLPQQAAAHGVAASMPLEHMVQGVRAALRTALTHRGPDLPVAAGAIH